MMVEMQCGMCGVVWNACCGIVWCVIYILMWWCAWRGARCKVGMMWNGVPRCGGVIWCELWCDVKCVCGVECCSFRHGVMWNVTEMQNVWYGIWRGVEYSVLVCGMLHNARCGNLRCQWCEMWCGIRVMKNVAYARCCVTVVWRQMWKMICNVLWCQMRWCQWCKIKMWWCNAMWNMVVVWNVLWCWMWVWCGIVADVEWCETWTVQWRGICCALRCGGVKWWWEADCSVRWCQM